MQIAKRALAIGRIALIGTAVCALVACGLSPEDEAAAIERDILATPGAETLWRTIKDEYPQEFDALVSDVQALDWVEQRDTARVEQIGADWLRAFFIKIAPDAVKAPGPELIAWRAAEYDLYATLQRGAVAQCASMTMGDWIMIEQDNAAATAAIARRNTAMVRASAAGRDDPQIYAEPDEAAFQQFGDAIAATGIVPELQAALASDAQMLALSPAEQCEVGVAVYAGLTNLPDTIEPQLAAHMFAPE